MNSDRPVIAIDGPSGSGKGTISKRIAQQLGWHYLDSGALYRLTALAALRHGVDLADEVEVAEVAAGLDVAFQVDGDDESILLEGVEVAKEIRSEQAGNNASIVAVLPAVRQALLQRQRNFQQPPGLVADGRDMGSVVFPGAGLKLFLTASVEERAKRRYNQLMEKGIDANLAGLLEEIAARDLRDSQREVAPLQVAPGGIELDTTGIAIEEVVEQVLQLVHKHLGIQV